MLKFLRTLRNHWKKTTFGVVLLGFGCDYLSDKYKTHQFMRVFCEEARSYGDKPIHESLKPRHVTVILNPAAKNGKGKKLYEKYVNPLLNLAGLRISLIQTEHEGQARQLMEIMDNTDAVIIAGGDGTLHEAVTGLLRREDEATASQRMTIGIAPIGKRNSFVKKFFTDPDMNEPRLLAESTMAVLRELHQPVDILEIQGETGKPVFAVNSVECGAFRDMDTLIEKYWYFGPLKTKIPYISSAAKVFKRLPGNLNLNVTYVLPCEGCSKCYKPKNVKPSEPQQRRWWQAFLPRIPTQSNTTSHEKDYSKVINEECGIFCNESLLSSNFLIRLNKDSQNSFSIHLSEPVDERIKFMQEGFSRHAVNSAAYAKSLEVREAQLDIQTVQEEEERWFSIDNEKYDKQNIKVTLLPSKVSMYVGTKPLNTGSV